MRRKNKSATFLSCRFIFQGIPYLTITFVERPSHTTIYSPAGRFLPSVATPEDVKIMALAGAFIKFSPTVIPGVSVIWDTPVFSESIFSAGDIPSTEKKPRCLAVRGIYGKHWPHMAGITESTESYLRRLSLGEGYSGNGDDCAPHEVERGSE